ncbi:MAG: PilZ domain-containing protein [Magnetococcus sp. DMHC-6]
MKAFESLENSPVNSTSETTLEWTESHLKRRIYARMLGKIQVVVTMNNGIKMWGVTRDISLQGVSLTTHMSPAGLTTGLRGNVRFGGPTGKHLLDCTLIYAQGNRLGLRLDAHIDIVHKTYLETLFVEQQVRIGAEITQEDDFLAEIHNEEGSTAHALLIKLNTSHITLQLFPDSPSFAVGQAVESHLTAPHLTTPVILPGVIRAVTPSTETNNFEVEIVFTILSQESVGQIRAIIISLHKKRLNTIIRKWGSMQSLSSDAESTSPVDIGKVRQDLKRFFGRDTD